MAITYTSRFHSDDDPGGVLGEILTMGAAFPGPAEDALLGWTLRLADTVDPAAAARRILAKYNYDTGVTPDGPCGDLVRMLREAANFSRGRLQTHLCRPEAPHRSRRRGGRRARRPS